MTAIPTGRRSQRGGMDTVEFTRTFRAPIDDVWSAVTEPDRMVRWIGTWTGDPESGHVMFEMTAEGEDVAPGRYDIIACEPPRAYEVTSTDDFGTWHLRVDLTESAGVTTLVLTQVVHDVTMIENTGPGWDFYLDRLVAAETGGDVATIDFDADYYPAQREHYVAIQREIEGS